MKSTKKLLMGISSLGLGLCVASDGAASNPTNPNYGIASPLTENSNANKQRILTALKQAAGGQVNSQNIQKAISSVVRANPGLSINIVAASIEQLKLEGSALTNAVIGMANVFDVPISQSASALITETRLNEGKDSAEATISSLTESLGGNVISEALNISSENNFNSFGPGESYGSQGGSSGLYNG